MIDLEEYLRSKGCEVKDGGSNNIRTHCFFHGEETEKYGRLYIQVEDPDKFGVFWCFVCGETGGLNKIRAHFGDEPVGGGDIDYVYNRIFEVATRYYHDLLFDGAPDYLGYMYLTEERGLTEETILQARLGWSDGKLGAHLIRENFSPEEIEASGLINKDGSDVFRPGRVVIPYLVNGRVVQLRQKIIGGKTLTLKNQEALLYGIDGIQGENTIFIAEGEMDQLHLTQLGYSVIGVPGAQTWKDSWTPLLADVKRAYIIYDNDKAGRMGAEKVAKAIGPIARIIEIPVEKCDVSDYIVKEGKSKDDIEYLCSKAKGGLLVTVAQAYERWTEVEGNPVRHGLDFNVPALDKALMHGFTEGQIMSMIARTNGGKTLLAMNIIYRMSLLNPDLKFLYFSLEQTRNEWFERMFRIQNFYFPGSSAIDTRKYWSKRVLLVDANRINGAQFIDSIDQFCYDLGQVPDTVVVDFLGYFSRGFPGDEKQRTSEAMYLCKEVAKEYQTRMIVPHQANRTGELGEPITLEMAKDSAVVEETSDLMLSIYRPEQNIYLSEDEMALVKGVLKQHVLKSRDGGGGLSLHWQLAPETLAIIPQHDPLFERARKEVDYHHLGMKFWQVVDIYKEQSNKF